MTDQEHVFLEKGDIVKIRKGASLFVPEETPIIVQKVVEEEGTRKYVFETEDDSTEHRVTQWAIDHYAQRLEKLR